MSNLERMSEKLSSSYHQSLDNHWLNIKWHLINHTRNQFVVTLLDYHCWIWWSVCDPSKFYSQWQHTSFLPSSIHSSCTSTLLFMPWISIVSPPPNHVVCDICNCSFHPQGIINHWRSCRAKQGKIDNANVFHHNLEELERIKKEARGKPPRIEGKFKVGFYTALTHFYCILFIWSTKDEMFEGRKAKKS